MKPERKERGGNVEGGAVNERHAAIDVDSSGMQLFHMVGPWYELRWGLVAADPSGGVVNERWAAFDVDSLGMQLFEMVDPLYELQWGLVVADPTAAEEGLNILDLLASNLFHLDLNTCQWFLTALSVLPGKNFAIFDHLFPNVACATISLCSSSLLKVVFLIPGCSWLNHLSLQLFPVKGKERKIKFR